MKKTRIVIGVITISFVFGFTFPALGASVVVAPFNASETVKAKADLVCDGENDEAELLESIKRAPRVIAEMNHLIKISKYEVYGQHSVEWLPGQYNLSKTLCIPHAADMVIMAEGSRLHYLPAEGDAVVIEGMLRCRYHFGIIETQSDGSALKVAPTAPMRLALMSIVSYTGLFGSFGEDRKGIGLHLAYPVCTNRFEGTDIWGFGTGILVEDAPKSKNDTNWFWVSYIRDCNTCIIEKGVNVDNNVWFVNVEANVENGVGIRTAAEFGKWYVIMGTWRYEGINKALILDSGARHNVFEIHPPIERFAMEDKSGNDTNVILSSDRPPFCVPKTKP